MIMFYAGSATMDSTPEEVLQEEEQSGVMLTFYDLWKNHGCTKKRIVALKKRKKRGIPDASIKRRPVKRT